LARNGCGLQVYSEYTDSETDDDDDAKTATEQFAPANMQEPIKAAEEIWRGGGVGGRWTRERGANRYRYYMPGNYIAVGGEHPFDCTR